jgi:hypothetical protein
VRPWAWAAASAVLIAGALAADPAFARRHHHHGERHSDAAEGRRHLKKANALAEKGRCADAVEEYTAAYEKLDDAAILPRRADCYREIDERAKAADDYRAYLEAEPDAPNRAEIEGRIAELEPARPRERAPSLEHEEEKKAPTATAAPVVKPLPAAAASPAPAQPTAAVLVDQRAGAPEADIAPEEPHGHWWLWTTVAVVVVSGAVATYLLVRPHPATAPPTTLGTYQF